MHPDVYCCTVYDSQDMETTQMLIDRGMDKEDMVLWYICTAEYYSAIKKNEIKPFATTQMDLGSVILSEVSQREKEKYHMICLMLESKKK